MGVTDPDAGAEVDGFYLLKPDALARPTVLDRVAELAADLDVVWTRRMILSADVVSALWWANRCELSPVGSRFLGHYLVDQESELVAVRGPGAQRRLVQMRRLDRRTNPLDPRRGTIRARSAPAGERPPRGG